MPKTSSDEISVDVRDLTCAVLLRWRIILLVGIIAAGAYFAGQKIKSARNTGTDGTEAEMTDRLPSEMDEYRANLSAIGFSIDGYRDLLREANDYLADSILLGIDPYAAPFTKGEITLETEEGSDLAALKALTAWYQDNLLSDSMLEPLAEEYGTQPRYLGELITLEIRSLSAPGGEVFYTVPAPSAEENVPREETLTVVGGQPEAKKGTAIMTLTVPGTDGEFSRTLFEKVCSCIREQNQGTAGIPHSLSVGETVSGQKYDAALLAKRTEAYNMITTMNKNLQSALDQSRVVEKPESESAAGGGSISKKKTLAVGLGGILGAVVLFALAYLVSPKIKNEREPARVFGLRYAGGSGRKIPKGIFWAPDRAIIRNLTGDAETREDETDRMIAANIGAFASGKTGILVTGSADPSKMEKLTERVNVLLAEAESGIVLTCRPDFIGSAEARAAAASSDGVLLAEETGRTTLKQMKNELDAAGDLGCDVIGYISL